MADQSIGVLSAAMIQDRLHAEIVWLERRTAEAPESLRPTLTTLLEERKVKADELAKRVEAAAVLVPVEIAKLAPITEKPIEEIKG